MKVVVEPLTCWVLLSWLSGLFFQSQRLHQESKGSSPHLLGRWEESKQHMQH